MLFPTLRHATSRCITSRAIRDGCFSTTARPCVNGQAAAHGEDAWRAIRGRVEETLAEASKRETPLTSLNKKKNKIRRGSEKLLEFYAPSQHTQSPKELSELKENQANYRDEDVTSRTDSTHPYLEVSSETPALDSKHQVIENTGLPELGELAVPSRNSASTGSEPTKIKPTGTHKQHGFYDSPLPQTTKRPYPRSEGEEIKEDEHGNRGELSSMNADSVFLEDLLEDERKETDDHSTNTVPIKLLKLKGILTMRNPQILLDHMVQESEDLVFMREIPGPTFVEILRQLHPEDVFSPLRSEYRAQGPKHYKLLSRWREALHKALLVRRGSFQNIAARRIASGRELGLGEYTQLLNLARATWDGPMALEIMKNMIAVNVQPNLTCYNYYFEARCWSDAYHPGEDQRLRVIPYNLEMRRNGPKRRVTDNVTVDGHRVEDGGIRSEITRLFTKMINEGINADTKAFVNLITAQSREGDLNAVKSVLHRVWNVNVDGLLAGTEADRYDRHKLGQDSITYPTEDLLFILAHAFGSNNDIPSAIRIVDHFSRKYDIRIPQRVWEELMMWTFVLSANRRKARQVDGASAGKLPFEAVESLWNVMINPPYNSEPNLRMYDYMIRSLWRRKKDDRSLYDFLDRMREGVKFHERAFGTYAARKKGLNKITHAMEENKAYDPETLKFAQMKLSEARDERWLAFAMARKWFMLLLVHGRWLKTRWHRKVKFERQILPRCVKEFWRYKAHRPIWYHISTGQVSLEDTEYEKTWAARNLGKEERLKWSSLSGDSDMGLEDMTEEIVAEDEFWADEDVDMEEDMYDGEDGEKDGSDDIAKELDDL